ncbi:bestrophin family ion channel [Fulvivirgaceae bacterium BMA12]|uniref:Bestrophin family ion channel n=1 Tax=Agaribacillus aureus TaxID=3051825 RepID=A0ABT8LC52_9BACT|nr:bestrophin family ion channel [Fulvivirgaceae bacterium BMA12]
MIVLKKVSLKFLFGFIGLELAYVIFLGGVVWWLQHLIKVENATLLLPSVTVFGTVLSLFLAFRTNEAYNRWWEARTLWGQLVNQSRNFARQVLLIVTPQIFKSLSESKVLEIQKELIYGHLAFINALRIHLRKQKDWQDVSKFLSQDDWEKVKELSNIPHQILHIQGEKLRKIFESEPNRDFRYLQLDNTLNQFTNIMGGCERIKNTVFPRLYSYFTSAFTWIFVSLLVLSLIDEYEWQTLTVRMLVAVVFLTLNKLGKSLKNPFENQPGDTPMSTLCRSIEIDLKEQLKEKEIPSPMKEINGILY